MDALPPDPYLALGLDKTATAAAIKTQYRKLALKCHPDKVKDESLKQDAADKFHRIQSAYEVVGDEDRRARYDAQYKLMELRKEAMDRGAVGNRGGEVRTASYKVPTESARGGEFYARGPDRYTRVSPQYEERRPSYAAEDYFDAQPRPAARKYDEYERERPSKRSPPKDDRPKAKASTRDAKESERSSRKDKTRRTEKEMRKDRDRKMAYVVVDEPSSSDSDRYERQSRQMRAEDETRRAREQYLEAERRQREEAATGAYGSEWHRRMFPAYTNAEEYMGRTGANANRARPEPERRPSPVRHQSSRDKVESLKRSESKKQPPVYIRRGSGPIKTSRRDSPRSSREKDREPEIVEEPVRESRRRDAREGVRPPPLNTTNSAPENIRPSYERQRSQSMQEDHIENPVPQMKRSETMPTPLATAPPPRETRGRKEGSKLRPEESYATPERTPEPDARPSRYRSGEYADDVEIATPDGYRTVRAEVREPSGNRMTQSPERMKEHERERPERHRAASSRHATAPQPPPMPRTTSTQYAYPSVAREDSYPRPSASREESYTRPAVSRENSKHLFGEVKSAGASPGPRYSSPPLEKVSTSRRYGTEDVKWQSGYTVRDSVRPERPSRHNSGRQPVYAS